MIKSNTLLDPIDSLQVVIEGDGRLDGFNIPAKNVNISILGKGYCEVNAILVRDKNKKTLHNNG